jgi:hypothetical protein
LIFGAPVTIEKIPAKEPGVAPGVTPAFLANRDAVIRRALGTIPENTISRRTVLLADADNAEDDESREEQ